LLHISQIAHERVHNILDYVKPGDIVELKLIEIQPDGKFRLSRKALLPPPEDISEGSNRPTSGGHYNSERSSRPTGSPRHSSTSRTPQKGGRR